MDVTGKIKDAKVDNIIWYKKAAGCWEETLPIGNGSLGAMIWGTPETEKLGLNLDTLWSGTKRDTNNYDAINYLEPVRKEIFGGHYKKAAGMIENNMLGEFGENYLPMGNLYINVFHEAYIAENDKNDTYVRSLNINDSVAHISYRMGNAHYEREYFASYPDKLIAASYRVRSCGEKQDKAYTMNLEFCFESELKTDVAADDDSINIEGQCPIHVEPSYIECEDPIIQGDGGICFTTKIKIISTDGIISSSDERLCVKEATYCQFIIKSVSGSRDDPLKVPRLRDTEYDYDRLKERHIKDYKELFDRVDFCLKSTDPDVEKLPTDQRLRGLAEGKSDNALYTLFFQYGRYLLISSSRKGSEAANLQGIWNWQMRAPWSSNYTTNINLEMNYWPAWVCNLKECLEPYYKLLLELSENGKKTAQVHFGCRGFCVGHNTDFWRMTNPVGVRYGAKDHKAQPGSSLYAFFVLSGQWMCQELWKNYVYSKDVEFLHDFSYPILKEAVLFAIDWLVEYEGSYVTCPSASPENSFRTDEGISSISMGCTMDMAIIRELFQDFENICRVLTDKKKFGSSELAQAGQVLAEMRKRQEKLLPYKIADDGRLMEWIYDFEETEPGHRHISHAFGLFPGRTLRDDKKLRDACEKSIKHRLSCGGGHTGWSCAWIANLFAVLHDGQMAYKYVNTLLTKSICPNLWTSHPPFQIDANFAGTMAIAQMLVCEEGESIIALPAIPKEWQSGYVKGLRISGNRIVDIEWDGNKKDIKIKDLN